MTELQTKTAAEKSSIHGFLDGAQLKWIAMASMLCDHVDKGIILNYEIINDTYPPALETLSMVLGVLGRIAFPIYLFLLVEGFLYTGSRWKYLRNLLLFGVISEVPYDMFLTGTYWDIRCQNMILTLAMALCTLWMLEWITEHYYQWRIALGILVVLTTGYLADIFALDYGSYGILIPVALYVLHKKRIPALLLSYLIVIKELWSVLGFGLLYFYNGKRGHMNKWIGYWFYPVHLFLIGLIRMYIL